MIGYTIAELVMMRLGSFTFGINTAAYDQLQRSAQYRWPTQQRFMNDDAIQYTGRGEETISLSGVILPHFRGGTGQLNRLRSLAETGQPQILISGLGEIMGNWVIEEVGETQEAFAAAGISRRQTFSLKLRRFGRLRGA